MIASTQRILMRHIKKFFENAKAVYESRKVQQIQVDDAVKALEDAYKGLTQTNL